MKTRNLLLGVYDIKTDTKELSVGCKMLNVSRHIASVCNMKCVEHHCYLYPVQGLTLIQYVAESHIVISTYPEERWLTIDVEVCKADVDFSRVKKYIKRKFRPSEIVESYLERGKN